MSVVIFLLWISKYTFQTYLHQRYFNSIKPFKEFGAEDILVTSFDSWKYDYEKNKDKWKFALDKYYYMKKDGMYFPYRKFKHKCKDTIKVVKFLTKKDYRKFIRYYNKNIKGNRNG